MSFHSSRKCLRALVPVLAAACFFTFSTSAHALDKRLKLLFKTAGYGAAAGFVLGAGSVAMGLGGTRNILMGTSSGLYAGIALAGYIIATPNEDEPERTGRGLQNPYAPRRPVSPEDYEEDDEEMQRHLPDQPESRLELDAPTSVAVIMAAPREVAIWAPVVAMEF